MEHSLIEMIKGTLIHSICTKFYYLGKHLHFQIIINTNDNKVLFKDFDNYTEYQQSHNDLVKVINNGIEINNDFTTVDGSKEELTY